MAWLDTDDEDGEPKDGEGGGQNSLFGDQFQGATGEAAGFLLPGAGAFDHEQVNRISEESGRSPGVVLDILQAAQRTGYAFGPGFVQPHPGVPQQAAPEEPWEVRAKARRASLNKVVNQVAQQRLRKQGGGDYGSMVQHVWAELKKRSGISDLSRTDIPELEKAIGVVREMWNSL
jgi:hypothetical protein